MWVCSCGTKCEDDHIYCKKCGTPKSTVDTGKTVVWYYIDAGIRYGPLTTSQMSTVIQEGVISETSLVWHKGLSGWIPAKDTELQQLFFNTLPKVTASALHSKWLWALAVVPLLVDMLFLQILGSEYTDLHTIFTLLQVGLNCTFLSLDVNYLKKAGWNIGKYLFLGLLLVPVYLFVRAAKTNKNFVPGIVWCGLATLLWLPIW